MKLRYYLRGLGIGILVTALILTIVPGEKEVLSDAEIRERALQLGMVDSSLLTLADVQGAAKDTQDTGRDTWDAEKGTEDTAEDTQNTAKDTQDTAKDSQDAAKGTEDGVAGTAQEEESPKEAVSGENLSGEKAETEDSAPKEETAVQGSEAAHTSAEAVSGYASITIKSGDSSYTVAKSLQAAGLIGDAGAFDTYLCGNGYSRSISTGTYEIPFGTAEEEIAKIISRKR